MQIVKILAETYKHFKRQQVVFGLKLFVCLKLSKRAKWSYKKRGGSLFEVQRQYIKQAFSFMNNAAYREKYAYSLEVAKWFLRDIWKMQYMTKELFRLLFFMQMRFL